MWRTEPGDKPMKRPILTLIAALGLLAGAAHAAGDEAIAWDKAPGKTNDLASLQNGAKLFVNYSLSCHSAAYMRFNRLRDIGLTEQQIKDNLLFTTDKIGETMKAAIDPKQAKEWFGANPPDLTVIPRSPQGHWLEQPGFPERGHAPCAVATPGRPATGVRGAAKPRPQHRGIQGLAANHARQHDAAAVRSKRRGSGELPAMDGRARAEHAQARGRLGDPFSAPVHVHHLAAARGLLEGREVNAGAVALRKRCQGLVLPPAKNHDGACLPAPGFMGALRASAHRGSVGAIFRLPAIPGASRQGNGAVAGMNASRQNRQRILWPRGHRYRWMNQWKGKPPSSLTAHRKTRLHSGLIGRTAVLIFRSLPP